MLLAESNGGTTATADSDINRYFQPREAHGIKLAVEHHDRVQVGRERVEIDDQRGERGESTDERHATAHRRGRAPVVAVGRLGSALFQIESAGCGLRDQQVLRPAG